MTTDDRIRMMRAHQRRQEAAANTNECAALVQAAIVRYLEIPTIANALVVRERVEFAQAAQMAESRALGALDELRTLAELGLSEWPEDTTP